MKLIGQALSAQDTGRLLTALLPCASWLPSSLFCGMHAIDMAFCMRTEQLSAMRLLKMADQHDPLVPALPRLQVSGHQDRILL
jgi:hypothetical protein